MTQAARSVSVERLETLLLARLAMPSKAPPTAVVLTRLLRRYMPTTLTDPEWRELVEGALRGLEGQQLAGTERQAIRNELQRRIGDHSAKKWEQWTDRLFPALALGVRLDDTRALRRLSLAHGWASAIAARALAVWSEGQPPTLGTLCDAVVWRELGIEGAPEECPPGIRAHFLEKHIKIQHGSPAQLVRQIASQAVEAQRPDRALLRDALVRRWLTGRPPGAHAAETTHAPPAERTAPAPAVDVTATEPGETSLVDAVRSVAHEARAGAFGDRKVFISSVWDTLRAHPPWTALSLDDFKARLVAAHRNRELVLARADLVAAMDPALVAASETTTDGATFHFIVREPTR